MITLPSTFCDNHLCAHAVERFPQIGILQVHPDAALLVGLWWSPWSAHVSYRVCKKKKNVGQSFT